VKKKTTRTAWWLSAILAVVLLTGVGAMLTHDLWLGRYYLRLRLTGKWTVDSELAYYGLYTCDQSFDLGFIILDTERPDPDRYGAKNK
jgi:hypothetical protein